MDFVFSLPEQQTNEKACCLRKQDDCCLEIRFIYLFKSVQQSLGNAVYECFIMLVLQL